MRRLTPLGSTAIMVPCEAEICKFAEYWFASAGRSSAFANLGITN
jgi:hypothetical protein